MPRNSDILCVLFTVTRKSPMLGNGLLFGGSEWEPGVGELASLPLPFNQHSGAIYLRSKSYLVVKVSSNILTDHLYQVCVLPMKFCRSDCRLHDEHSPAIAPWSLFRHPWWNGGVGGWAIVAGPNQQHCLITWSKGDNFLKSGPRTSAQLFISLVQPITEG